MLQVAQPIGRKKWVQSPKRAVHAGDELLAGGQEAALTVSGCAPSNILCVLSCRDGVRLSSRTLYGFERCRDEVAVSTTAPVYINFLFRRVV